MTAKKPLRFPASLLERIVSCPGSAALSATAVRKQNFAADRGQAAHQLAQWTLTDGNFDTRVYLGRVIEYRQNRGTAEETVRRFKVDEQMCAEVQDYVDAVRARLQKFQDSVGVVSVKLFVEERVDTSNVLGVPRQYGTADVLILAEYKDGTAKLSIEDLKFGKLPVEANDNFQLMTYGAALLDVYKADETELVIHMPRLQHVSVHAVTAAELRAFGNKIRKGVDAALEQDEILQTKGVAAMSFNPSEKQCMFCPAQKICPAFNARAKKPSPKTPKPKAPPRKP